MLLDVVSLLHSVFSLHLYSSTTRSMASHRTFTSGMSIALPTLLVAVYVLLARDFHVSVDEVVSSFASFLVGGAIWMYVVLI